MTGMSDYAEATVNASQSSASQSASVATPADPRLGTPLDRSDDATRTKVLLLGSGELGREIAIELMRLGAWVCAADSYEGAPAQQVAHEYRVLDMANP